MSNLRMWNIDAYRPILTLLDQHKIPERYPDAVMADCPGGRGLDEGFLAVRDEIRIRGGYAVLTWEWLRPLAKWIGERRCLEIMGGCGSFSKCLQDLGVSVLCTDSYSWEGTAPRWFSDPWTAVERLDARSAIEKYGGQIDIVICSWPFTDDSCRQALLSMRRENRNSLFLFVGEIVSDSFIGATANQEFFEEAVPVEDEEFERVAARYVTCYLLRERPMLFR